MAFSNEIDPLAIAARLGILYVPFLFSLCLHEYAHGWVARKKGDNTAFMLGRLTMNPLAHIDIVGTVFLPIAAILAGWPFFGWAKPVPVNSRNFKKPKNDMFWVAAAGPLSNIILATLICFLLVFLDVVVYNHVPKAMAEFLQTIILLNLFLGFFNLIPLHPLDGGKILARFLPAGLDYKLESNQHVTMWILIAIFAVGGFQYLAIPVFVFKNFMIDLAYRIIA